VRVEGVRKAYGSVKALDGVSIDVAAGEFLALLGPSGSGKTTLLMTIAGFEVPDGGTVLVDGRDVTHVPPNRRNLGMVFQRYALFPHMSLRDNVGFPLRMRGVPKAERDARADRVLATVGLEGYGSRLPAQLSGGQQQRVALARAIVYEPPVLLMDEPLSALDKNLRERMRLEIKHLQKSLGITVVFVTHDQEEALVMADRIAVLDKGLLVQEGGPRALYERPGNPFVAGFLGETNFLEGAVAERRADRLMVRLSNGATVPASLEGESAGAVRVSVRPEYIDLSAENLGEGAVEGRLAEIIFAGASTIYLVDVGLKEPVNVRKPSSFGLGAGREGDRVWLRWAPGDARAFPA
jgi:putative spermidine/putrescine transport system ATP-binding protein/mannopine transport system ATP-binding protein